MKKIVITSLVAAFAAAANSAPLVTVGDQMDIFFKGAVLMNYNSNITYASDKKIDDVSGTIRLGGEVDYGRSSKFKANLKAYEDFTKYASHGEFDCNLAHLAANASYVEANWKVSAFFAFDQNRQNTTDTLIAARDQGQLVNFNNWAAGFNGEYDFTEKVFATLGFKWTQIEYTSTNSFGQKWDDIYSSYNVYSVPVSVYYRVTQKISAGLSYQYRNTEYYSGPNSYALWGKERDDHFIGVTVLGEIAPKLTCEVYLGAQNRDVDGIDSGDEWSFATRITLGYEVSEKMGVYAKFNRDFGNSATRDSIVNTGGEIGMNYYFNPKVYGTASFAYTDSKYEFTNRKDKTIWTRLGVTYVPNKFVSFGVNYNYLNNDSSYSWACYNQHLVSLNAMLRY